MGWTQPSDFRYTPPSRRTRCLHEEGSQADEARGVPAPWRRVPFWPNEGQRGHRAHGEGAWTLHPPHSKRRGQTIIQGGHHITGMRLMVKRIIPQVVRSVLVVLIGGRFVSWLGFINDQPNQTSVGFFRLWTHHYWVLKNPPTPTGLRPNRG